MMNAKKTRNKTPKTIFLEGTTIEGRAMEGRDPLREESENFIV
jgi:hypothetical protein